MPNLILRYVDGLSEIYPNHLLGAWRRCQRAYVGVIVIKVRAYKLEQRQRILQVRRLALAIDRPQQLGKFIIIGII